MLELQSWVSSMTRQRHCEGLGHKSHIQLLAFRATCTDIFKPSRDRDAPRSAERAQTRIGAEGWQVGGWLT